MSYSIAAVGTSWGGLTALTRLLGGLPADFSVPIVVVQHRSKDSDRLLPQLLQDSTELKVCEIEDKDELCEGTVHVAPANYHVLVESGYLSLSIEEPVRFSRPSIDVTFASAGDAYGAGAIGVILTGANEDGARGLAHIVKRGGRALIQDPKTAAIREVPTGEVIPLGNLAPRLMAVSQQEVKARGKTAV